MIPKYILEIIEKDNYLFCGHRKVDFLMPKYDPDYHYLHLTNHNYFLALLCLRSYIKLISDYYLGVIIGAKNIDLFILTASLSSPMGSGSDSKAIPIKFGNIHSYLVDSSQFGFEPLLLNKLEKVYCYMPSMRGENFDKRHLNQFFHCEMEIRGKLEEIKPIIVGYVKIMCEIILASKNIVELISADPRRTQKVLEKVVKQKEFKEISFDSAVNILEKNGRESLVNYKKNGRDINFAGEIELLRALKSDLPVWINNFDRDRVPFYQKIDPNNTNKTINADLLFPPLLDGAFGGEIVGSGQRQDNSNEIYESLRRQNLNSEPYEWYINLRRQDKYQITSGFGLGIERFISWALGFDDIKNSIIYPRLKNIITYP